VNKEFRRRRPDRQNPDHAHVDTSARHAANHRRHVVARECSGSVATERIRFRREKGQAEKRPGLLSEIAHNKIAAQPIYFPPFGVGGTTTSLCCAQAPSPNAETKTAITTIIFKNFNLSRLLSQQVAPVCLGRELRGSNAFLKFFKPCGKPVYFE
jgi:hypothetical protein